MNIKAIIKKIRLSLSHSIDAHQTIITMVLSILTIVIAALSLTQESRYQTLSTKFSQQTNRIDKLERSPHFVLTINDLQSTNEELLSLSNESTSKLKNLKISTKTFIFIPVRFDITNKTQIFPTILGVPEIDNNVDRHSNTTGQLISYKLSQIPGDRLQQARKIKKEIEALNTNKTYQTDLKENYSIDQTKFIQVEPYIGVLVKADVSYKLLTSNKIQHKTLFASSHDLIRIKNIETAKKILNNAYSRTTSDEFDSYISEPFSNEKDSNFYNDNFERFNALLSKYDFSKTTQAFDTFYKGQASHRGVNATVEK